MHIWLVNHNQALVPHSCFTGWLPSVFYIFSACIIGHPDGNLQWLLSHHIREPSNPLWNVMIAIWCTLSVVPRGNIIHFYLFMYLFFLFRDWPLVTGVQSEECCGFLAVNIWPRTERACCRSKVRDLNVLPPRYFQTLCYLCAIILELLRHSWQVPCDISSKNEIQYDCHKVCC